MQYIVLDLEWNGAYSKQAHGYFNEIIEIGAVRLNEQLQPDGKFHVVIRPQLSRKLSEIVTNLTSITAEELGADGISFMQAGDRPSACIRDVETVYITWSTTDLLVLMENVRFYFHQPTIPFMAYYADLQAYFQARIGAAGGQQIALKKACEMLEITEEGLDLHRAVDDSVLTARILMRVYEESSFAGAVYRADDEFYRRITFKTTIVHDLNSPYVHAQDMDFSCECGAPLIREGDWRFRNRGFMADMVCPRCKKEYTGWVQVKLKYEGPETRKKRMDRIKPKEEKVPAQAASEA